LKKERKEKKIKSLTCKVGRLSENAANIVQRQHCDVCTLVQCYLHHLALAQLHLLGHHAHQLLVLCRGMPRAGYMRIVLHVVVQSLPSIHLVVVSWRQPLLLIVEDPVLAQESKEIVRLGRVPQPAYLGFPLYIFFSKFYKKTKKNILYWEFCTLGIFGTTHWKNQLFALMLYTKKIKTFF
jgi:hypothetical protein